MQRAIVLVLTLALLPWVASGQEPSATSVDREVAGKQAPDQVRAFLAKHCLECHGPEKPKGKFRVDRLSADFTDQTNRERWSAVLQRVQAGEMPPKEKPRPIENEIGALTGWISARVEAAEAARRAAQGRVVLRRLNRVEYTNTVRDLLGIEVDLREMLALDGAMDGFDNVGAALHLSSFALERYLEAADAALNAAIVYRPQPPTIKKQWTDKVLTLEDGSG